MLMNPITSINTDQIQVILAAPHGRLTVADPNTVSLFSIAKQRPFVKDLYHNYCVIARSRVRTGY